jgi:hypothetical protein
VCVCVCMCMCVCESAAVHPCGGVRMRKDRNRTCLCACARVRAYAAQVHTQDRARPCDLGQAQQQPSCLPATNTSSKDSNPEPCRQRPLICAGRIHAAPAAEPLERWCQDEVGRQLQGARVPGATLEVVQRDGAFHPALRRLGKGEAREFTPCSGIGWFGVPGSGVDRVTWP